MGIGFQLKLVVPFFDVLAHCSVIRSRLGETQEEKRDVTGEIGDALKIDTYNHACSSRSLTERCINRFTLMAFGMIHLEYCPPSLTKRMHM